MRLFLQMFVKTATWVFFWSLHHALRPKSESMHVQDLATWLLSFLPESSGINRKRCKSDSPNSGLCVGTLSVPSAHPPPPSCGAHSIDLVNDHSCLSCSPVKPGAYWEVPGSLSSMRSGFTPYFCFHRPCRGVTNDHLTALAVK